MESFCMETVVVFSVRVFSVGRGRYHCRYVAGKAGIGLGWERHGLWYACIALVWEGIVRGCQALILCFVYCVRAFQVCPVKTSIASYSFTICRYFLATGDTRVFGFATASVLSCIPIIAMRTFVADRENAIVKSTWRYRLWPQCYVWQCKHGLVSVDCNMTVYLRGRGLTYWIDCARSPLGITLIFHILVFMALVMYFPIESVELLSWWALGSVVARCETHSIANKTKYTVAIFDWMLIVRLISFVV